MAVVKMSEFKLLVRNDSVDVLLKKMQGFKDVTFSEFNDTYEGFKPYESQFDFDGNLEKQELVQEVLKRLSSLKKKDKKTLFEGLSLQEMRFDDMVELTKNSNLDHLLSLYSEHYESGSLSVGDFKVHIPWEEGNYTNESMKILAKQKVMIGRIDLEKKASFKKELKALRHAYFMVKDQGSHSIFVVTSLPEYRDSVSILCEKYEMESRSAVSLHIETELYHLRQILDESIVKRETLDTRLQSVGHYQDVFKAHYESLRNEALREDSKKRFLTSDSITFIRGWVMTEDIETFTKLIDDSTNGLMEIVFEDAPLHSLEVPIKLKNNRFVSAFEPITNMYSQPRYDELDPTPIFSVFYAMFFGMMLADVGYGLVMGMAMFFALKALNLKPGTQNMVRLLLYVSVPTMFWGVIYGSFFGGMIPLTPVIDINTQFNHVLVMALIFGIFHLFVGLGVKAYIYIRDYKIRYVIYDVIFWYMTLLGIIVLVSQMFTDALSSYSTIATVVMAIGMVGIVLTNGRDAKTVGGKAASGLYSLYGITNYIGDVVSYSRLMALGLAGASIGVAFNMMVEMVSDMGPIGVLFGALIFIFGHTFNLLISGLSSYVHAARLTYVEFFGKFFTGGGKAFKTFVADPTYIQIEKEL